MNKEINKFSTKQLVEELKRRPGVKHIIVDPHTEKEIIVEGPAIILEIID